MKTKYIFLGLLTAAMALTSCKEKAIYKNFETQYTFSAVVPANSLISSPLFPISVQEENNAEGQYAIHDTRKDLVEEVYISSFLLEVAAPNGDDLSFLNSANFYIDADQEPELRIAYKDPVPSNVGRDLLFDHEAHNLAPYIRKDPFTVRTSVVTDENRTHDIELKGTIKFQVKAKVIGFE